MGEIDGSYRAWGFAKGGTGGISASIAQAAQSLGAQIRTNATVQRVLVKRGKAKGVVLESGEEIAANLVVSSLDPKGTFLDLLEPGQLPGDLVESIQKYTYRGSSGKVNLALDAAPELACKPGVGRHLAGAISISPSIDYIERAYDDAKYGAFSKQPYIDIILPSMIDPDMAPPGKHVMSCFVQYAPYALKEGSWEEQRQGFGDTVVDTLSEYFPNLKNIILHRQVLTPWDMEQSIGLTEGNIFQGELSLSQLFFMRPAPGLARYRTPVRDYYQCGSATHPGGGISGASGRLAALEILKDWRA
jgi:phytoene dehydrogenase-like protein